MNKLLEFLKLRFTITNSITEYDFYFQTLTVRLDDDGFEYAFDEDIEWKPIASINQLRELMAQA